MSRWFCAALVAFCLATVLIGCRSETRPPAPGDTSQGQARPQGLIATTQPREADKQPEFIPSPNNLQRVRHLALSVTLFTLSHELGHMVAEEYNIPMVGSEENSADRFATLLMVPNPKPAGSPPDTFDPVTDPDTPQVVWAAWFWNEMWRRKQESGELPNYASRHGLDISRSVEVMCLTYGSDPSRFERPFRTYLPEASRGSCVDDAHRNLAAWQQVLERGQNPGWWKYQGRVSYHPAPQGLDAVRKMLMESALLDQFASGSLNQIWVPERAIPTTDCSALTHAEPCRVPIELIADPCLMPDGKPDVNAYWVRGGARQMVLCYGWVNKIEEYARETIARTEIGQREKMPGAN